MREFDPAKLSAMEMDWLKDTLAKIEKQSEASSVSFALYENGQAIAEALKGKAGYSGVMIEAPYYIALRAKSHEKAELIRTGYYLEMLNTELIEKNLGTCWITTAHVDKDLKKSLFGEGGEFVDYIIGFGKAEKQDVFEEDRVSPVSASTRSYSKIASVPLHPLRILKTTVCLTSSRPSALHRATSMPNPGVSS